MKHMKFILVILLLSISFMSCEKFLNIEGPTGQLEQEDGFVDSLAALSTTLSVYGYYYTTGGAEAIMSWNRLGALSSDDAYYYSLTDYDNFRNNTLTSSNEAQAVWSNPYLILQMANFNIEKITAAPALTQTLKDQLIGEMKFWRAYLFFNLVNFFGDIPMPLNSNSLENARLTRTPVAQVYEQMVKDLIDAKELLKQEYPSIERARINRSAVSALLARVYLYQKNYVGAEAEATAVINQTADYTLESNLDLSFLKTSREVIWQNATTAGITRMGAAYLPASTTAAPVFVLQPTLVSAFEPNDRRRTSWTRTVTYQGAPFTYPYKYKQRSGTGSEYSVMLRLSEQYLIRAEARAEQLNLGGAITDLDMVRNRADIPLIGITNPSISKENLIIAIDHERQVEFFTENSERWFNLKRRGNIRQVLLPIKPLWEDFQSLYPIPLNDLNVNSNLEQNFGYER